MNLTRKKTLHAAERSRPDVAKARAEWRETQPNLNPGKLAFLDETWTKTNMVRLHGRPPRGERLIGTSPRGRWKTATFLAGLRQDVLPAPAVFDGPINGDRFLAYVEQILAPTLTAGDTAVWAICPRRRSPLCAEPSMQSVPAYGSHPPTAPI